MPEPSTGSLLGLGIAGLGSLCHRPGDHEDGAAVDKARGNLGRLEIAIMEALWRDGTADVATMHAAVGSQRGIVRNTIQSTLERLVRKGLARRRKVGRAFEYEATLSRAQWLEEELEGLLTRFPSVDPPLLVSTFVNLAERIGTSTLDELEARVRERRRSREEDE